MEETKTAEREEDPVTVRIRVHRTPPVVQDVCHCDKKAAKVCEEHPENRPSYCWIGAAEKQADNRRVIEGKTTGA